MLRLRHFNKADEFINGECSKNIASYEGPLNVVVDIGAHVGFFTFAAINKGAGEVWAFEPQPQNYEKLVRNVVEHNLLGRVIPVPLAIAGYREDSLMSIGKAGQNDGQNGIMMQTKMDSPYVAHAVSLDHVHDLMRGSVDYLKIDIEGAEYLAFEDQVYSRYFLDQVNYLEIELHDPSTYRELEENKIPEIFRNDPVNILIEMLQDYGFSENAAEAKKLKRITSRNLNRSV